MDREYGRSNIYTFEGGRQRLAASVREFETLPIATRNKYNLFRGHAKFGIHRLITQPFTYITILREPISRIVSHYNYVLRTPEHALHDRVTSSGLTIEQYVSDGISTELNNGQVRLVSGVGANLPFGECDDDLLAKAITNLETDFSVVGLAERFDETILLMSQNLQWKKKPLYIKRNVAKFRGNDYKMNLPPNTIDIIRKYNALDIELYEYATAQFRQALKSLPNDSVQHFQRMNSIYYPYGRFISKVTNWLRVLHKKSQRR